jgi:hypothetical protein
MSSGKVWNWLIAVGTLVAIIGLLFFPAALNGPVRDEGLLGAGGAVVGIGTLIIAFGFYFKTKMIRAEIGDHPQLAAMLAGKRSSVACDLCAQGGAVIYCSMHKKSLCGNCLAEHYDSRHCVYVPAARRSSTRSVAKKATAARSL